MDWGTEWVCHSKIVLIWRYQPETNKCIDRTQSFDPCKILSISHSCQLFFWCASCQIKTTIFVFKKLCLEKSKWVIESKHSMFWMKESLWPALQPKCNLNNWEYVACLFRLPTNSFNAVSPVLQLKLSIKYDSIKWFTYLHWVDSV